VWDGFRWVYGYVCIFACVYESGVLCGMVLGGCTGMCVCAYESGVRCGTVLGGCTGMCVYPRAYMRVVCCVGRF